MRNPDTVHWRDSARTPKLFVVDAYAVFPMVLLLLHVRPWTFYLAFAATSFFIVIRKFGFPVPVFLRLARAWIAGTRRLANPWWNKKKFY